MLSIELGDEVKAATSMPPIGHASMLRRSWMRGGAIAPRDEIGRRTLDYWSCTDFSGIGYAMGASMHAPRANGWQQYVHHVPSSGVCASYPCTTPSGHRAFSCQTAAGRRAAA
jgi:hypothetical protein